MLDLFRDSFFATLPWFYRGLIGAAFGASLAILVPWLISKPEVSAVNTVDVFQGGVVVGKVHGARRNPVDATSYEFVEITHAQQFNLNEPFNFAGHAMRATSAESIVHSLAGRSQDGTIIFGLNAKIL